MCKLLVLTQVCVCLIKNLKFLVFPYQLKNKLLASYLQLVNMFGFVDMCFILANAVYHDYFLQFKEFIDARIIEDRHHRMVGFSSLEIIGLVPLSMFIIFMMNCCSIRSVFSLGKLVKVYIFLFLLSIPVHYYLGVNTQLLYLLGFSKCPPDFNSLTGILTC